MTPEGRKCKYCDLGKSREPDEPDKWKGTLLGMAILAVIIWLAVVGPCQERNSPEYKYAEQILKPFLEREFDPSALFEMIGLRGIISQLKVPEGDISRDGGSARYEAHARAVVTVVRTIDVQTLIPDKTDAFSLRATARWNPSEGWWMSRAEVRDLSRDVSGPEDIRWMDALISWNDSRQPYVKFNGLLKRRR